MPGIAQQYKLHSLGEIKQIIYTAPVAAPAVIDIHIFNTDNMQVIIDLWTTANDSAATIDETGLLETGCILSTGDHLTYTGKPLAESMSLCIRVRPINNIGGYYTLSVQVSGFTD